MEDVKGTTMLVVCALVGLLSALATRNVFLGVGIMLILFIAWGMWKYIKDITKQ
jgi:hypothetical protein